MDKNEHDHTEEIAREMYSLYVIVSGRNAPNDTRPVRWNELDECQRDAWRCVAKRSLSIIGNHALEDVKEYLKSNASSASGWKKWVLAALLAALGAVGYMIAPSCTGIDNMILSGERGQINYTVTPDGNKVIVITPVNVLPSKK